MSRYFTFEDDKSSKFWQIETLDATLTVSYGRIGTAGQSQTKTFDTPDRCEQEAAKLIREKIGKGYTELVNGQPVANPATPAKKTIKPDDGQELQTILTRYDEIIQNTLADELLPFLKSVDKRHLSGLRKKIKEARKYWCDYVSVPLDYTGPAARMSEYNDMKHVQRGTNEQQEITHLAALACLSLSEVRTNETHWLLSSPAWSNQVLSILRWSRPTWLTEFLTQTGQKNNWHILSYSQVRLLEKEGLINYEPNLFALSVSKFSPNTDYKIGEKEPDKYINFLTNDHSVIIRDIPTLFDYQTLIQNTFYHVKGTDENYEHFQLWPVVFTRLLAEGKLDRLWFFERCLSVQTKDWATDLRSFYRKQIETNYPTNAEWLALQSSLLPLLAGQHPHVVSWAVTQVKAIYTEPDFRVGEFLDWAAPVMMRADCKTALKTLLTMLERVAKTQPEYRPAIANLLANVFAISDLSVQTKAAQLLVKFGDSADATLQNSLQTYAGQMLGTVSADLRAFLETDSVADVSGPVTYQYAPPKPGQRLVPGQEVSLPKTWNEFVFLIGKFIGSDDPLDAELLMNALILPPADMPDDWQEQLAVYGKKLEKTWLSSGLKDATKLYLLDWMVDTEDETQLRYSINLLSNNNPLGGDKIAFQFLKTLNKKRKDKTKLSSLSLPTHTPCWVDPPTLIKRLLVYQQANEPIDSLDLAVAIARMPRENVDEAVLLSKQLTGNIAALMQYCLGFVKEITVPKLSTSDWLLSVFKANGSITEQQALWAVAARTFEPDAIFLDFAMTSLADFSNVVNPLATDYQIKKKFNEWKDLRTGQLERYSYWPQLIVSFANVKESPPIELLYSYDLYEEVGSMSWQYQHLQQIDLFFWCSLIPQLPEGVFAIVAKYGCVDSDTTLSLINALHLTLKPGFHFREMSMLVLACGLLTKKRETGALAAEVLIQHFGEQTLDATRLGDRLGWLLAGNYAPVQRLTDALNLVRDVSPRHNKALLLLLDALLAQLATMTELPKNTKKLLEGYLDLLVKCAEKPTAETAAILTNWREIATLKKLCQDALTRL